MKSATRILICMLTVCCAALLAPRAAGQVPVVSGTGPVIEGNFGFEYLGQQVPSSSRVPMYGVDSGLTVGVSRRFGVRLDVGYARAGNVFSSGHHSDVLSYLAGPVFYPTSSPRMATYVELLAGGARVTGATPDGSGGHILGYANKFAWAGGAGLEMRTRASLAFRVGADYLHTAYFDPNIAVKGEGSIRGVASVMYYFGGGGRR